MKRLHYEIRGMHCAACVAHVEKALRSALSPSDTVSVSLLTNSVSILLADDPPSLEALEERLAAAVRAGGYTLLFTKTSADDAKKERRKERLRLCLSALLTLAVMYLAMGGMLGLAIPPWLNGAHNGVRMALAQLLLTLPVLFLQRRFFISGVRALLSRAPNMDSLIAVGAGASVVYGVATLILMISSKDSPETVHTYLHDLYFESAAMILTLVSLGKQLESGAKDKAADAIRSLASLAPKYATLLRDGKEIAVETDKINVGDVLLLRPGDLIPVDGTVTEGVGATDESAITGESLPVEASVGSHVRAAAVVTAGFLTVRAEEVGENTSLARILRLLEDAAAEKPPIARVADRVSRVFVPAVMLISLITFLVWMLLTGSLPSALRSAIAVLVISCPCALGLATPTAITVGLGRAASRGILFRNATALERLASVRTVLLDKTGTITEGNPSLTDVASYGISPAALLSLAAAIEEGSSHPLALAVRKSAEHLLPPTCEVKEHQTTVGVGVSARVGDLSCAVVKPGDAPLAPTAKLLSALSSLLPTEAALPNVFTVTHPSDAPPREDLLRMEKEGKTVVAVTAEGMLLGLLGIADRIRPEAEDAVTALHTLGLHCRMLTGDRPSTARAVADAVGITDVDASLLPEDKEAIVRKESEVCDVAMVGDGINDAPSLVRATVGIAIGAGTETAIEAADVVLSGSSPMGIAEAVEISRATLRIIRQNLFWALFYNALCIPIAAGVLYPVFGWQLSPMLASAAMSLSSVTVVSNALRLKHISLTKGDKMMFGRNKEKKNCTACAVASTYEIAVGGMMCPRCVAHVKTALEGVAGVTEVTVSLEEAKATVTASGTSLDVLLDAVRKAGYEASEK